MSENNTPAPTTLAPELQKMQDELKAMFADAADKAAAAKAQSDGVQTQTTANTPASKTA